MNKEELIKELERRIKLTQYTINNEKNEVTQRYFIGMEIAYAICLNILKQKVKIN